MNKYDIIERRKQDVGRRIRLVNIIDAEDDPQMQRLIGMTGTIERVDDAGNYHVNWDDSPSGLLVLIEDTVEFIDDEEEEEFDPTNYKDPRYGEYMAELRDREWDARYDKYLDTLESRKAKRKTRKNTMNESFDDQELSKMVADHEGLISFKGKYNYSGVWDARQNEVGFDLKAARPAGYISKDILTALENEHVDFWKPLKEQLLFCNDGGAIIIERPDEPYTMKDTPYEAKVRKRNDRFREEHGKGHYPYMGVDAQTTKYRREQHYGRLKDDEHLYFRE